MMMSAKSNGRMKRATAACTTLWLWSIVICCTII